jgi:hypothetical protein
LILQERLKRKEIKMARLKGVPGKKNPKLSAALKGNTNAKGSGGGRAGAIGTAVAGPLGSLVGGALAGSKANKTLNTKDKAQGERIIKRARRASAITGGIQGAIGGGIKGAIVGAASGNVAAGAAGGAALGGAAGAGMNYAASRVGAKMVGSGKSNYKAKKK